MAGSHSCNSYRTSSPTKPKFMTLGHFSTRGGCVRIRPTRERGAAVASLGVLIYAAANALSRTRVRAV